MLVKWNEELLKHPDATVVVNERMIYRGLRCAIGSSFGNAVAKSPCKRTGKAEYFGPILNEAARVAALAHAGQILVTSELIDAAKKINLDLTYIFFKRGKYILKGVKTIKEIHEVIINYNY